MSELATPQSVREQIAALSAPLREQLLEIEKAAEAKKLELGELNKTGHQLRAALRAVDPSFLSEERAAQAKKNGKLDSLSPALMQEVDEWLKTHREEVNRSDGITATALAARVRRSQSQVSKALAVLHDNGTIRLDRRGRGGSKIFKVV